MKKSEYYVNKFPEENILPNLHQLTIQAVVLDDDYTIESDKIAQNDFPDDPMARVNISDACYFFELGYKEAQKRIEQVLKPYAVISAY